MITKSCVKANFKKMVQKSQFFPLISLFFNKLNTVALWEGGNFLFNDFYGAAFENLHVLKAQYAVMSSSCVIKHIKKK